MFCSLIFLIVFGGNRSSGFGLIYDNFEITKKVEPKYRLAKACSITISIIRGCFSSLV